MHIPARDRLIVGLDLASLKEAERMVARLGDAVSFYKIGFELALSGGIPFAADLARSGKKVFLDLKLHDIGNTVARAAERAAALGMTFLTVHAFPQTMRAAAEGRGQSGLKILGVTVLTSWDENDVKEAGYAVGLRELVGRRADQAKQAGIDGLIASPVEAAGLRAQVGRSLLIVTPGVRPAGAAAGDQKRVMTPAEAIKSGADHIVVARPVIAAPEPRAAAEAIVAEIGSLSKSK
ncbi:MAG: orotidine-5'-phosphate decarboxylase [Bradyrhizobiaceae bacterium]|nr:orotidine-5'-phosphate decarboxylase [Bradyrhizobiaceae bacterium]